MSTRAGKIARPKDPYGDNLVTALAIYNLVHLSTRAAPKVIKETKALAEYLKGVMAKTLSKIRPTHQVLRVDHFLQETAVFHVPPLGWPVAPYAETKARGIDCLRSAYRHIRRTSKAAGPTQFSCHKPSETITCREGAGLHRNPLYDVSRDRLVPTVIEHRGSGISMAG